MFPSNTTRDQFMKLFNLPILKYWHPVFGFDIIRFDEAMKSKFGYIEDGKTSCRDFVAKRFGGDAADFIDGLINGKA